jgi:excisionase family DNA binding protein
MTALQYYSALPQQLFWNPKVFGLSLRGSGGEEFAKERLSDGVNNGAYGRIRGRCSGTTPARLLDLRQVLRYRVSQQLGFSVKTIYGWVYLRQIPYVKMGRLVKFDPSDIKKWIETKKSRRGAIQ